MKLYMTKEEKTAIAEEKQKNRKKTIPKIRYKGHWF